MNPILRKTFGGLSKQYYIRQFIFSIPFLALLLFTELKSESISVIKLLVFTSLSFIYPYSRFVYESVVKYIMGNNILIVNLPLMLAVKAFTMFFCYMMGFVIAPIGLAYLYFHFTAAEKKINSQA
ncbi:hypothetical protein VST7929_01002 [Vibrio stylophorae]|uniref:Uncharacterized protein n=1 Tax=Vibrio stylophorae TaxID=659351 RepID=A0ABM8ZS66_9VIBR|nr:hypothetical protein [Vibrio stylophorae]CAH0533141.1 hypothetical protein VST7929_01002 [Vibrio stylophorae]